MRTVYMPDDILFGMRKSALAGSLILLGMIAAAQAQILYGTYTLESRIPGVTSRSTEMTQPPLLLRTYTGFDRVMVGPLGLYAALECNLLHRPAEEPAVINHTSTHQFLLAGMPLIVPLVIGAQQKVTVFVEPGIAVPLTHLTKNAFFLHVIADYRKVFSNRLAMGLGILVSYHNGSFKSMPINLLPYCDWKATDRLSLEIQWDHLSLIYALSPVVRVRSETRYDLVFAAVSDTAAYQQESAGTGLGFNWKMNNKTELDMYAGYVLFRNEQLKTNGVETVSTSRRGGVVLKCGIVF